MVVFGIQTICSYRRCSVNCCSIVFYYSRYMNKNRLENFSDGVFAFAVTLLVLNIHIPLRTSVHPGLTNNQLNHILIDIYPRVGTFAFSFLVIGVFWIAHHRIFGFVRILDSTLLWLNILYLLFIALIPVAAGIISEYPFLPTAILLYSITLLIIAFMHFVILEYILRNRALKHEALTKAVYKSAQRTAIVGPICYIAAAATSFINVYISLVFIVGAMIFYIFFSGKGKMEETVITVAKKEMSSSSA
jgi:uncharacterized membrane protein